LSARIRILGAALAGLALSAALPAATADAATYPLPKSFTLGSASVNRCLEIADWRTDNGAPARLWDCTRGGNQLWHPGPNGTLVNDHSGKCLEIADWRKDNGAPARQWGCSGGANQRWTWTFSPRGFSYRNVNSGKCLEIADWRTDNGAPIRQWDCTGGDNQHWWNYAPS
jgi:hypothetical protein